MTLRPDLEALIQGAVDDTLTPEERRQLDRLMTESAEARGRVAHLRELTDLLDSLGPAEPPAGLVRNVLDEISESIRAQSTDVAPSAEAPGRVTAFSISASRGVRPSAPGKAVALNRKIMFGLAAAAVLVLAVLTFNDNPPPTGTEATIGAAQRATNGRAVLQTETRDQLVKDETLWTLLQDANVRVMLQNAELRQALAQPDILRALRDSALTRGLTDAELVRSLNDAELVQKLEDANLRAALGNRAFADALRNDAFRAQLARVDVAAALARPAFQNALRDPGFDAALRSEGFAEAIKN